MTNLTKPDYSTSQTLLDWLALAQTTIEGNKLLIADLLTQINSGTVQTKQEQVNQLQEQLKTCDESDKPQLEQELQELIQTANPEQFKLERYLTENEFIGVELTKLLDPNFLNERQEIAQADDDEQQQQILTELAVTLSDNYPLITSLQTSLADNSKKKQSIRRDSLLGKIQRQSSSSQLTSEQIAEEEETPNAASDNLKSHLTTVERTWNNHLTNAKEEDDQAIKALLPFLEQASVENADFKTICQSLLTEWTTNYPNWYGINHGRERFWLNYYLNNWDTPGESNKEEELEEVKDKLVELEINNKSLEASLIKSKQVVKDKNKEWAKLNERSTKDLEKAVKAKDKEYKAFINPNNKEILAKNAKDKLNMSTEAEVAEEVNKAKIPLQVWEKTFLNKTAQQVAEFQEQLQQEKQELNKEKAELIKGKEKLANERRKFLTDLKSLESQFKSIKEDREALEEEKETYLNGFDKAKDETGNYRDEIARLKAIIYDLGIDPDEGKEAIASEEENNNSAEDDDGTELKSNSSSVEETENDNSDNESLLNEETKSVHTNSPINSEHSDNEKEDEEVVSQTSQQSYHSDNEQEEQEFTVNSEQPSRSHTPVEEEVSENDEEKEQNKLNAQIEV